MTFLPIVERELRVASRHAGTQWIRFSAALVALLIGGFMMFSFRGGPQRRLGMGLFVSLSIFCYAYCILVGLRTTADCLSQEKREGTLGLLFLTDLKGYDIVLGKLAATSLNALYGLLAVVPIMALPLLLGGVTVAEFWRVVLCAFNGLFFSLATGMFISSVSTDERRAMFRTLGVLLFFVGVLPLLGALELAWRGSGSVNPIFFLPSPGFSAFGAFDSTYQMLRQEQFAFFWGSVGCVHALAWGFLWLACRIIPYSWGERTESVARIRRREWWHGFKYGAGEFRKRRRAGMLAVNPIYWLTGRDRARIWGPYVSLAGGAILWLLGWAVWKRDWVEEPVFVLTALAVHTLFKLRITAEASYRFAQDKRSGSLELLLSTPLRVRQIVGGQLLSLTQQFLIPVLLVLGVDFLFLLSRAGRPDWEWIRIWLAGMGIFAADMVALAWVGMWLGLATGRVSRAVPGAVFRIMALPWIVWTALMVLCESSQALNRLVDQLARDESVVFLGLWVALGLGMDLAFGLAARHNLLNRFRAVAPQRGARRLGLSSLLSRDLPTHR